MRFGSSTFDTSPHATEGLRLQARFLSASHAGHGVVRIPHTSIIPLDATTTTTIRQLRMAHQLRCVIHAPIAPPHLLHTQLSTYAEFLTQIEAVDGVIICHMLSPSPDAWHMLRELPAPIRTYLAVELTNQPVDSICNYGIPIIFDWLHYHIQGTWPYNPLMAAVTCHHTWGTRRPLLHLSSPDTSDYGEHHKHIHGRHSAYLDWATLMHFVGQLNAHIGDAFDIEIEAKAGAKAVAHFLRQCQLHTPPHWQHIWQSRL